MPIIENVGGVLRTHSAEFEDVGGVIRKKQSVLVNDGGVMRTVFSADKFSSVLALNTWEQIAKASETGKAKSLWSVGDEINITVSGEGLTLVIMGFDHDTLASGGKAGITFGLKHLMKETRKMNTSNNNSGGFTGSVMYSWLQSTLFKGLPSDLQKVIKSVYKWTSDGEQDPWVHSDSMKLFLFSEVEIFGTTTYSAEGEGSQYVYFTAETARSKRLANGTGVTSHWWWERSPTDSSRCTFCRVNSGKSEVNLGASNSGGVCFGFCV